MTNEERRIEEEIAAEVKKRCKKHVHCEGCAYIQDRTTYFGGCWGRAAIKVIQRERKQIKAR